MKKRLDILSPLLPTVPLVGGSAHIVGAAQQLAHDYQVRLFALVPANQAAEPHPQLAACAEVQTVPRSSARGWLFDPPAVRLDHSAALREQLSRVWREQPPTLVQIEFTSMAQYARLAASFGARTVCTAHNLAFLAQIRRARREAHPRLRARRWLGALSLWAYELRSLRHCDLVITLNTTDAAALHRWLPRLAVRYLPSGVNLQRSRVCFDPTVEDSVLFVGSYQHPPNVEGAQWLAREVWPLVRQAHPNAQLILAGRGPGTDIRALESLAGVTVTGTLEDLEPIYANASLMAAPILWGGGVRIKILDGLARGLPLVTTHAAAEGIALRDGQNALFGDTPQDFAAAILRLLDDRSLRQRLGQAGRQLIERNYDWQQIGQELREIYGALLAQESAV